MADAKLAEKEYQNHYKSVNEIRLNYIEISRNILNEFEVLNNRYTCFLKDILQKYIFFQITFVKSHDFNLESKLEVNCVTKSLRLWGR